MLNLLSGALVAVVLSLSATFATATEWPSLDLSARAAAGNLPEPVEVIVDDPVYHEQKTYSGYPLTLVLALGRVPIKGIPKSLRM